jgi:hypothetical protein
MTKNRKKSIDTGIKLNTTANIELNLRNINEKTSRKSVVT